LNEIVRRHESLRTAFETVNREPIQHIVPELHLSTTLVDLADVPEALREQETQRLAKEESLRAFDLTQIPLVRSMMIKLRADEHVLLLTMHHIISDAWSSAVFMQEFAAIYEAYSAGHPSPLPELTVQYADYSCWQREFLTGSLLEGELAFWRKQLQGAPPVLQLPADRPRPEKQSFSGRHATFYLANEVKQEAEALAAKESVTLFMLLISVFQTLLGRYAGEEQIVVGTDVANRPTVETERMIGFFINLLPVRTDLSGDPTFRELLSRVRNTLLASYSHQQVPFEKLVEELRPQRSASHNPLVQVLFVMQNTPRANREFAGLKFERFDVPVTKSKFDVAVFASEAGDGIRCDWIYSADLFENNRIERMAAHFETMLRNAIASPDSRLSALEMLSAEEKQKQNAETAARKRSGLNKLLSAEPKQVSIAKEVGRE
jgi:hypothetical protein